MSAAADSFNEIATVRIELKDSDPLIWRQVEVPTSITLKTLHAIIQATIGWHDYHLWEFAIAGRRRARKRRKARFGFSDPNRLHCRLVRHELRDRVLGEERSAIGGT